MVQKFDERNVCMWFCTHIRKLTSTFWLTHFSYLLVMSCNCTSFEADKSAEMLKVDYLSNKLGCPSFQVKLILFQRKDELEFILFHSIFSFSFPKYLINYLYSSITFDFPVSLNFILFHLFSFKSTSMLIKCQTLCNDIVPFCVILCLTVKWFWSMQSVSRAETTRKAESVSDVELTQMAQNMVLDQIILNTKINLLITLKLENFLAAMSVLLFPHHLACKGDWSKRFEHAACITEMRNVCRTPVKPLPINGLRWKEFAYSGF
jgi:hypothetical protein